MMAIFVINNYLHASVGFIALAGALVALIATKGSKQHILGGRIFAILMILAALTSLLASMKRFQEIGPLVIFLAVGSLYLVISGVRAIKYQQNSHLIVDKILLLLPIALLILLTVRLVVSIKSGNFAVFIGPTLFIVIFVGLLLNDIKLIRNLKQPKSFWLKRHLTRMILAFSFAIMALVRIGVQFGLSFQLSVILPLVAGLLLIAFFRKKVKAD